MLHARNILLAEVKGEVGDIRKRDLAAHPFQKLTLIHLLFQLLPDLHH